MAKITVHGGPSIAGATVVGAAWSDTDEPDQWPTAVGEQGAEPVVSDGDGGYVAHDNGVPMTPAEAQDAGVDVQVSVDGVDQGPGEVEERLGGPDKPLPEAVEGDTTEYVSESDYEASTVAQLREVLAERELPTSGNKAELIERLRAADEEGGDG